MNKFRLGAVLAVLAIVVCAIAGCGTSTVSVADVTYKDMPLQIHNEANVTALNKATITPAVSGAPNGGDDRCRRQRRENGLQWC